MPCNEYPDVFSVNVQLLVPPGGNVIMTSLILPVIFVGRMSWVGVTIVHIVMIIVYI